MVSYDAGQVVVAGNLYDPNSSHLYDFGQLLYAQINAQANPVHTTLVGTDISGSDASLITVDSDYLVIQQEQTHGEPVVVQFDGNVGTGGVSELSFHLVMYADTPWPAGQRILFYNWSISAYQFVDQITPSGSDQLRIATTRGDPSPYIDANGNVKAQIIVNYPRSYVHINQAVWKALP